MCQILAWAVLIFRGVSLNFMQQALASHTCAVLDTGGEQCWGSGVWGALGDGSSGWHRSVLGDVVGLSSGVAAVSSGGYYTCALLDTGGVMCWGSNSHGQVGDGTTTIKKTPVDVSGLSTGVVNISSGDFHSCAVLDTGGVKCWGENEDSQLGDGTTTDRSTPVDVIELSSDAIAVSAGSTFTCAVLDTGGVACWGNDAFGKVTGIFPGLPHPVVCM